MRLIHLPHGHGSLAFTDAFEEMLAALPEAARRILTWDQGSEMARHHVLAEHFFEGVFFADPGSPWVSPLAWWGFGVRWPTVPDVWLVCR